MFESMLASMLPGVDLNAFAADLKRFVTTAEEMNERTKRIEERLNALEISNVATMAFLENLKKESLDV